MATTVSTIIPTSQLTAITSELPDAVIFNTDSKQLSVNIWVNANKQLSVTLYPYNGQVKLYDLRSIIENTITHSDESFATFYIEAYDDEDNSQHYVRTATHTAIFCDRLILGDSYKFITTNFLTTRTNKQLSKTITDSLEMFVDEDEEFAIVRRIAYQDTEGTTQTVTLTESAVLYETRTQLKIQTSYNGLMALLEEAAIVAVRICFCTIIAGQRSFYYYFNTWTTPELTLMYRNAFHVYEYVELNAVTTEKQTVDRSQALCAARYSFYDQDTTQSFEVVTAPMLLHEARWLAQVLSSDEVYLVEQEFVSEILITESTYEVSDADDELNTVKFTYRSTRRSPRLLPSPYAPKDKIFQSQFDNTYE